MGSPTHIDSKIPQNSPVSDILTPLMAQTEGSMTLLRKVPYKRNRYTMVMPGMLAMMMAKIATAIIAILARRLPLPMRRLSKRLFSKRLSKSLFGNSLELISWPDTEDTAQRMLSTVDMRPERISSMNGQTNHFGAKAITDATLVSWVS